MIFAVGAGSNLVGRTSACDYPAESAAVPVVGGYGDPAFEMLLSLRPDRILYVDLLNKDFPARLKERGLDARLIRCLHLDDIPAALAEVGELAGQAARGRALADSLRAEFDAARAAVPARGRPRVFVELWDDPLYTVGRGSFVSELVTLAGGTNIGDEVESPYFTASPEWVISRNPEVILCLFMGDSADNTNRVARVPAFASLAAVKDGRLYSGFDLSEMLRPGPRVMNSVAALRRCLHPDPPQGAEKEGAPK
jgi:iron complex transport system substrate-binding protein